MERPLEIVAIGGSLRRPAYTRGLLAAAAELAPGDNRITTLEIDELPLYDADRDESYGGQRTPPPVKGLREMVSTADGLLLGVTEYNWGPSAPLKNAIDWLSRPLGSGALTCKPIAMLGTSPGPAGTGRAQLQLRQNLASTRSFVMPFPIVQLGHAGDLFDEDFCLRHDGARAEVEGFMIAFGRWIGTVSGLVL